MSRLRVLRHAREWDYCIMSKEKIQHRVMKEIMHSAIIYPSNITGRRVLNHWRFAAFQEEYYIVSRARVLFRQGMRVLHHVMLGIKVLHHVKSEMHHVKSLSSAFCQDF